MNTDNTSISAPEINRRRFFFGATAGLVAAAAVAPAAAAEPEMTLREKAIWHLRELERMAFEAGADNVFVAVIGLHSGPENGYGTKSIMISTNGVMGGEGNMFAQEGGVL